MSANSISMTLSSNLSSSKRQRTGTGKSFCHDHQPVELIHKTRSVVQKSIQTLIESAQNGDVESIFKLGKAYLKGKGLPADINNAFQYFHSAADKMYLPALSLLAKCYTDGIFIKKNTKTAFYYSSLVSLVNNRIYRLDLSDNFTFAKKGCKDVAACLQSNTSLQSLSLFVRNYRHRKLNCIAGSDAMYNALKINSILQSLVFRFNNIGEAGGLAFAEILTTNHSLTCLELSRNKLRPISIVAIAEALTTNATLTSLNLEGNVVADQGACSLSSMLMANTTLMDLNLNNTCIFNSGITKLSSALIFNSTLTTLNLGHNSFIMEGGIALFAMLKQNSSLISLNIQNNEYARDLGWYIEEISEMLIVNSTLIELNMAGEHYDYPFFNYRHRLFYESIHNLERISQSFTSNQTLQSFKWNFLNYTSPYSQPFNHEYFTEIEEKREIILDRLDRNTKKHVTLFDLLRNSLARLCTFI